MSSAASPAVFTTDRPIIDTARAIDEAISRPVLVLGSMPPHGRDLDLLARGPEHASVARRLEELGHVQRRSSWVRFLPGGVSAVELFSADAWHLAGEGKDLFRDAVPVPGYHHLVRPAPHVVLLLAARGLVVRRGRLTDKARRRIVRALTEDPDAWTRARLVAPRLGLTGPLSLVQRAEASGGKWSPLARVGALTTFVLAPDPLSTKTAMLHAALPRRFRPALISLSGPHGTGKSTQVELLRSTLNDLGVVTETQWAPAPARRVPRVLRPLTARWWGSSRSQPAEASGPLGPVTVAPRTPRSSIVRLLAHVWCAEGALVYALRMWRHALRPRRAQALVLDRFTVDASVALAYWIGHRRGVDLKVEQALFRLLSPRPRATILLLARAETLHSRRADEYTLEGFRLLRRLYAEAGDRFGAVLLDADRAADEVARDVASVAWTRLP